MFDSAGWVHILPMDIVGMARGAVIMVPHLVEPDGECVFHCVRAMRPRDIA